MDLSGLNLKTFNHRSLPGGCSASAIRQKSLEQLGSGLQLLNHLTSRWQIQDFLKFMLVKNSETPLFFRNRSLKFLAIESVARLASLRSQWFSAATLAKCGRATCCHVQGGQAVYDNHNIITIDVKPCTPVQ